jgi:hypothetical protein
MKIEVTGAEEAKEAVDALSAALADKPALHARIAKGVRPVVSNWLLDRDGKAKRKPGWPRSGYWGHAAESASGEADAGAAWVIIRKEGVGLHLRGGTVEIPAPRREARHPAARRAGRRQPARKVRGPRGRLRAEIQRPRPGRARLPGVPRERRAAPGVPAALQRHPRADPTVLPPDDRLAEAARRACASYVRSAARKFGAGGGLA